MAGFVCLRETDLKSLVAYSSVSHMRFVVVGLLRLKELGWWGARVIMIAHGLRSSGMFYLVNSVYKKHRSRRLLLCGGLLRVAPGMVLWWFCGVTLSRGVPPSASLVGEILILCGGISRSFLLSLRMMVVMFLGLCYGLYLYGAVIHGSPYLCVNPGVKGDSVRKMVRFLHFVPLGLLTFVIEVVVE